VRTDTILLLVDAGVRAALVLAGGWALTVLLRRASASARHFTWMCAIAAAGVMPVAAVIVPDWHVASLSRLVAIAAPFESTRDVVEPRATADAEARGPAAGTASHEPARASWQPVDYSTVAVVAWLIGVAGVGLYVGAGVLAARRMRRRASPVAAPWVEEARVLAEVFDVPENIDFIESADTVIPVACGVWRPAVVMPLGAAAWPRERLRVAVLHELAHIRRRDCATQAVAQLVCALYWFNPLAWLAASRLRAERERACDDFVLEAGTQGSAYAAHLLEIARMMWPGTPAFVRAGVAMAHRSQLEERLMAILNPGIRRSTRLVTRLVTLTATVVMSIPVAALQPQDPSRPSSDGQPAQLGGVEVPLDPETYKLFTFEGGLVTAKKVVLNMDDRRSLKAHRPVRAIDRALVWAAAEGDVQGVNDMIVAGANVNATIEGDGSPLIAAARGGALEIVRLLLDRGADANLAVPGDGNPLIAAAREGRAAIVELLLQRGALVDQMVEGDENALIQASGAGRLDVVKLLVSRGADVNARVWVNAVVVVVDRHLNRGELVASDVVEVELEPGTAEIAKIITDQAEVHGEWRSPLSVARRGDHKAVVDYLIRAGAQD
jgi:beta-lactamase regulating signal transducer with metallopeptidase domain/ankyrin repeat protein